MEDGFAVISIATCVILELHFFYSQCIEPRLKFITKHLFYQMDVCTEITIAHQNVKINPADIRTILE